MNKHDVLDKSRILTKYRVSGKACLADADTGLLADIQCVVYGSDLVNACENLINNNYVDGFGAKLAFVAVTSGFPNHLECPLTGGFLSFVELDD